MDYTVHGILHTRILEWVAFPFSRGSSQPRDRTQVSRIAGGFFNNWATRFSLLIFGDFPVIVLLVISSLIPLWSQIRLYDFCFFKLAEVYFISQNVVCLGECFVCAWEECASCCCWTKQTASASFVQLMGSVERECVLPDFSACSICPFLLEGCWSVECSCDFGFIYFSSQFFQILSKVVWYPVVRCTHVGPCYGMPFLQLT